MSSVPHIIFKAFKATSEPDLCQAFIKGHTRVLESVGVKKLSSADDIWAQNPDCYVIIAQHPDDGRVLGGTRLQIASTEFPLPIEKAIGDMDSSIYDFVANQPHGSCGEMCGMWNSREIAGYGVGSTYLNRIGIALVPLVGIQTLLGLAAAWTLDMGKRSGFTVATQFGNNGTFYYPKEDFVATAIIIDDVLNLPAAQTEERALIHSLRQNPNQQVLDQTRMGQVKLTYELEIPVSYGH